MILNLIIVFSISLYTLYLLIKDYKRGLCTAVFFLILMPRELFIDLGGALPTVTGFRAVILILISYFLFLSQFPTKPEKIPILKLLILVLLSKIASLTIAYNFAAAFKGVLVFAIETVLFYIIIYRCIEDNESISKIVYSMSLAILMIALLGFFERYTHFNPVDYIVSGDHLRFDPRHEGKVLSTFSHSIHFGTALSMGWPICLYIADIQISHIKKRLVWIGILIIFAGAYFSQSRGAWLSMIGATMALLIFKYPRIKKRVVFLIMLTALVLLFRPGVYDTIHRLTVTTVNPHSLEGSSFYYRFELFKKAYKEISKSSERLLFGYGDGAVHLMELRDEVSYGRQSVQRFWSWDSEFAAILMQGGFVGLILNLILYFSAMWQPVKRFKFLDEENKYIVTALIVSNSVLIFMMTNVAIFAPQLKFIFWTNTAMGIFLTRDKDREERRLFNSP